MIDDAQVAALLTGRALVEIRSLASRRPSWDRTSEENLDRIRFLADICHNLPATGMARSRRLGRARSRQRPMSWTWNTTGPDG